MNTEVNDKIQQNIEKAKFYKTLVKYSKNPSTTTFASILLAILLFSIVIVPSFSTIKELKAKITELSALNDKLVAKLRVLENLNTKYEENENNLFLVEKATPNTPEAEALEKEIRYYMEKNGLNLKSLSISDFPIFGKEIINIGKKSNKNTKETSEIEMANFGSLNFSLTAQSSYDNLKIFLNSLQNNIRIKRINNVTISSANGGLLNLTISGEVYYYKKS